MILAVGIVPNTERLGLEGTHITYQNGHIRTNEWCMTDEPGIYAIGDVASGPWLAHKASHEGVVCVEHIAHYAGATPIIAKNIPSCTYSSPSVASVGYTVSEAERAGYTVCVGRFPYAGNGKAMALNETEGLVKTVFDQSTGEILGAHIVGYGATEMIGNFLIGRSMEATEKEFMHSIMPHPTLSEMVHESVLDAFSRAIHH